MSVRDELKNCINIGSFVGAATIVAEETLDANHKLRLIRKYALLAIEAKNLEQARHLVTIRYPRLMTARVRWKYWRTVWF